MSKKRLIALGIVAVLLIINVLLPFPSDDFKISSDQNWKEDVYAEGGPEELALLSIDGAIVDSTPSSFGNRPAYDHQTFLSQLEHAFTSDRIEGIILRVNSPGGGVYESDEIYQHIIDLQREHPKPLVVYMDKYAASGGYYISAPADKIFANRNTITGSIGVIIGNYNYHQLAENHGVYMEVFKSGLHKDIMSPMKEMSDEEREIMQSLVDESFGFFVDVVAQGRNMAKEKVIEVADGRIYSGPQAKQIGLVDEIGALDDAIAATAELSGVENPTVIRYTQAPWSPRSLLLNPNISNRGVLNMDTIIQPERPRPMYLWVW
ncbi:protease-4 [Desulfitispora alkaliphila]|uniref:signal peptide peptidase SppA n=1 Tax=Desulfitispora alkaliphila TaxID=622674 RepID=UPI003D1B7C5B